jgi:hypothetical protein
LVDLGLCDVEGGFDDFWDGLDLRSELLLDTVESKSVVIGDQIDGNAWISEKKTLIETSTKIL